MSPTRISIDFGQTPLLVGGLTLGKYIVVSASTGINLKGDSLTRDDVVNSLRDARSVVKSFFGAPNFDAVVIVIPNTTPDSHLEAIINYGRGAHYNITQVIREYVAVASAYVDKVRPARSHKLAIISVTAGVLDISILTVDPVNVHDVVYTYDLISHQTHPELIDFDKHESSGNPAHGLVGLVGGVVKTLVIDPIEKTFDILNTFLEKFTEGDKEGVEKVIFVGKKLSSHKVREPVIKSFHNAEVWEGIENPDELAAYGAAVLSYKDRKMNMSVGFVKNKNKGADEGKSDDEFTIAAEIYGKAVSYDGI